MGTRAVLLSDWDSLSAVYMGFLGHSMHQVGSFILKHLGIQRPLPGIPGSALQCSQKAQLWKEELDQPLKL